MSSVSHEFCLLLVPISCSSYVNITRSPTIAVIEESNRFRKHYKGVEFTIIRTTKGDARAAGDASSEDEGSNDLVQDPCNNKQETKPTVVVMTWKNPMNKATVPMTWKNSKNQATVTRKPMVVRSWNLPVNKTTVMRTWKPVHKTRQ